MRVSIAQIRMASATLRSRGCAATPASVAKLIGKPVKVVKAYRENCFALSDAFDSSLAESGGEVLPILWSSIRDTSMLRWLVERLALPSEERALPLTLTFD